MVVFNNSLTLLGKQIMASQFIFYRKWKINQFTRSSNFEEILISVRQQPQQQKLKIAYALHARDQKTVMQRALQRLELFQQIIISRYLA